MSAIKPLADVTISIEKDFAGGGYFGFATIKDKKTGEFVATFATKFLRMSREDAYMEIVNKVKKIIHEKGYEFEGEF